MHAYIKHFAFKLKHQPTERFFFSPKNDSELFFLKQRFFFSLLGAFFLVS
jgi:hypothetical protein